MRHHLRHHDHGHLHGVFGSDTFGVISESIALFFGTPKFIIIQTLIVMAWIVWNTSMGHAFDPYPFVFLNLVFSTQAAYASPFILLAAKRQADRDKASESADARHREELATESSAKLELLHELMWQNTELTEQVANLTKEVHELVKK